MTSLEPKTFADYHPLVIETGEPNLPPLRFRDIRCAARTALDRRLPVTDESTGHTYSLADCNLILNATGTWQ